MKKILALVLALCLVLCSGAFAAEYKSRENWPITTEDVTITIMAPKAAVHSEWAEMDLWKWLTEQTGLKFEFITPNAESWQERLSLTLGSGDLPDLIIHGCGGFSAQEIVQYGVEQGLFVAMDEYFDYAPNIKAAYEQYPEAYASSVAEDGHIYTQNYINNLNWTATWNHLFLNTTWLERVGKEIPTTIEEYHDVLKAFKEQDANGNGDPTDEIPLGANKGNLDMLRSTMLSAYGLLTNGFEIERSTGNIVYAPITENYKAYLKMMHNFWVEGLLDIDMFSQDGITMIARAAEDLYGSFASLASFGTAPASMIHDFAMLTPLTSEMNADPLMNYTGAFTLGAAAICSTSEHIEEIMMLLDWMYTKEGVLSVSYGPNNYAFNEETGAHYFVLADGTGGADDNYRGTLTFAPSTNPMPLNMRASKDSYDAFYADAENNYNNSILWAQINEHAFPYMHQPQPTVIWTSDEAYALQSITDMESYVESMEAQFITGDADIDAYWDTYVENVKSYGYDEIAAAYTSGWTRYQEAIAE